jgi:uncharacterized protein (DUF433 family)
MPTLTYPHLAFDAAGQPVIAGANTPVLVIAIDRLAHHWDADEIRRQRPHLTLGQIYSALAYYYDNEAEMNRLIAERESLADDLVARFENQTLRARLQAATRRR